jgi:hypothetical protein
MSRKNYCQRLGLAAGWEFKAVSAPMTMHIKERKILFTTKSKLLNGQAPQQKIGRGLMLKKSWSGPACRQTHVVCSFI